MPELRATFTADDTDFQRKVGNAERSVGKFGGALGGLQSRLVGLFSIGAGVSFFRGVVDAGEAISAIADSTGLSPRFVQSLQALGESRGALEKTEMVINRLTAARFEALSDVGSSAAKNLRQLGMNASTLKSLSVDDYMLRVAAAIAASEGNARKMAAATELIGARSAKVIAVMKDLAALGKEGVYEKFKGQLISDEGLKNLDKFDARMDRIKREAKVFGSIMLGVPVRANDLIDKVSRKMALSDMRALGQLSPNEIIPNNLKAFADGSVQAAIAGQAPSPAAEPASVSMKAISDKLAETNNLLRAIKEQPQGIKP